MRKRRPFYCNVDDGECFGIMLPSENSENGYMDELNVLEALVKQQRLEGFHKDFRDYFEKENNVGVITEAAMEVMAKYFYIDEESGDQILLFYGISEDRISRFCRLFIDACENDLGYSWRIN